MNWYLMALKNYAGFNGRSRRKEYWMYGLFNFLIAIGLLVVDMVIGTFGILYTIYLLGTIVPSLAVLVRRLHDLGKSGTWFFIGFIPLVGPIWLLVLMCTDGEKGENKYGPDPKNENAFGNDTLDGHLTT